MTNPRIAILDIERVPMRTKQLEAWDMKSLQYRRLTPDDIDTWGRTICLAYRWLGEARVHFIAEWQEGGRAAFLQNAWNVYDEADMVVGHNSINFDTKHLQGEWELEGLGPSSPVQEFDTLLVARKRFNFEANHLDTLTKRLGLASKTDKYRSATAWAAVDGDEKAQRRIQRYNIGDVKATTGLYLRLRPWGNSNLGVFIDGERQVCPACASPKVQRRGAAVTKLGRYPRFHCQSCGHWSKGKKALGPTTEGRPA